MSSDSGQLFEQILTRLNKIIEKYQLLAADNKQTSPDQFLEQNFKKELSILINLSKIKFNDALSLVLNAAARVLKQTNTKDFKSTHANALCIYYALACKCCNATEHEITDPPKDEEGIKSHQSIKILLIDQAAFIYGELPPETAYVRDQFSGMLSSLGTHYAVFYDIYFENIIQNINTEKNLTVKNLPTVLAPLMNLPGNSIGLRILLEKLTPIIASPLLKTMYRQQFSDMFRTSIMKSLKKHFLLSEKQSFPNYQTISQIMQQIDTWNEKHGKFTWPTQLALMFLGGDYFTNPDKSKDSLFDCLSRFPELKGYQKEPTLMTLLTGFRIHAISCNNTAARSLMEKYYDQFLSFFLNPKSVFPSSAEFTNCVFVDFPISVLFFNKNKDFKTKILPFLKEKSDGNIYIAKIIRRLCCQATVIKDESMFDDFIETAVTLFKNAEKDPKPHIILDPLITAFHSYPPFFKQILCDNLVNIDVVLNSASKHPELPWQLPLLSFFESFSDVNYIYIISVMLTFLFNVYCETTLYSQTQFGNAIPQIFRAAALCPVFQQEKLSSIPPEKYDELKTVIKLLEASSLLLFASSKKVWRKLGANILKDTLNIVHTNSLTDTLNIEFPVDNYHLLTIEALKLNPTNGHAIYKNPLRTITPTNASEGYSLASQPLYQYFLALAAAMNHDIHIEQSHRAVNLPMSELIDEFIGCASILFAITISNSAKLFEQAATLMKDRGDLGAYTVATIPSALNFTQYSTFIDKVIKMIEGLKQQGVFIANNNTSKVVENVMGIVRGLAEQKCWENDTKMVGANLDNFATLLQNFVNYCTIVPDMDCRRTCCQCIVSVAKLMSENDVIFAPKVRHEIAKTLLGWLSNTGNRKLESDSKLRQFFSITQTALALLLDNLSLMDCTDPNDPKKQEEQAENQFMLYFVAIKQMLETNYREQASELIPVLASLLKQNLTLGMEHCISMGFSSPYEVRAAFIGSLASVFKIPEAKASGVDEINDSNTLIDVLYSNGFDLIEYLAGLVPYSRADTFGAVAVEAAILKGIEFPFLERMVEIELRTIDESSKNTLFRGNAVPARSVGHYPRVIGTEWMIKTLRPLFDEVISNCETKGWSYIVDPLKAPAGSDLEVNKTHFRELLNKTIDIIADARESMPVGLIREMQLIYHKVFEKYGDFAMQILGGFLFLRFLLPAFTISKLVGLPELLPDAPRGALMQTCTVLMAAINKGSLDDKAEHFQSFNDLAAKAYHTFMSMFGRIVGTDSGEGRDSVVIDEEKTISVLHTELWPLISQISNALTNGADADENSGLHTSLERLLQKIQSMGQPKGITAKKTLGSSSGKDEKTKAKSGLDNLMKMKFKDELLQQLNDFFIREEHNATDGSAIYYMYMERLAPVTKTAVVPYVVMKKLMEETNQKITIVVFLSRFNESKIPAPNLLKMYSEYGPILKVTKYIFLEPNEAFVQFAARNAQLFDKASRFFQVSNLAEYTDLVGPPSRNLPLTSLESLSKPDSIQRAVVNRTECNVRIHQQSIQFVSNPETVGPCTFSSVNVILPTTVAGLRQKPNSLSFEISAKDGRLFSIEPKNSTLYDATSSLYKRTSSLDQMINKVKKVEASTLQWLMLNLAFVNMVDEGVIPSVRKAALDLIYAVFSAFSFERQSKVAKLPMESLPENLLGFVTSLSEDIAVHNPDSYAGFMTEFFNATHDIKPINRIVTFNYLRPWISAWAKDIETHPEFTDNLIKAFLELNDEAATFSLNIWDIVVREEKAREYIMRHIFKSNNDALIQVITSFAVLMPEEVSKFWADTMMGECIQTKDTKILYVSKVLTALLASHLFDTSGNGSSLVILIYNILNLRLIYPSSTLMQMIDLFGNILHSLVRINGCSLNVDYTIICDSFGSDTGLTDIIIADPKSTINVITKSDDPSDDPPDPSGCVNKRPWLARTQLLATTIRELLLNDRKTTDQLYSKFSKIIDDLTKNDNKLKDGEACIASLANALVYAGAFSGTNAEKFVKKAVKLILKHKDHTTLSACCISLSMVKMDKKLASKLFYIGTAISLYLQKGPAIDLIGQAIKQFGADPKISVGVSNDVVDYLEKSTNLKYSQNPIFSSLVLFALFSDSEVSSAIDDVIKSGATDPFVQVLSLINSDEKLNEVKKLDFGADFATVAAACLLILKNVPPKSPMLTYMLFLLETKPKIFGCFGVFEDFGVKILESVSSPTLSAQIYFASLEKTQDYALAPIVIPTLTAKMQPVYLKKSQIDYIIQTIFDH